MNKPKFSDLLERAKAINMKSLSLRQSVEYNYKLLESTPSNEVKQLKLLINRFRIDNEILTANDIEYENIRLALNKICGTEVLPPLAPLTPLETEFDDKMLND